MEDVAKCRGKNTWSVGIDEDEEGIVGEDFLHSLEKERKWGIEFPFFSFGSVSENRRIHDDTVVSTSTTPLSLDEFHDIFEDPADTIIGKSWELHISLCPANGRFARIDMCDFCSF